MTDLRTAPLRALLARRVLRAAIACLLPLGAAVACGDGNGDGAVVPIDTQPGTDPRTTLNFLSPAPGAPQLQQQSTSFWAVQGRDTRVSMYYVRGAGSTDSTRFLDFRVRDRARMTRPDGSAVAAGDSVLITITVVDPARLIVDFQPQGLRFGGDDEPTKLNLRYVEQDHDFDDDGSIDDDDARIETSLAIWRREAANLPWYRMTSRVVLESDEVEAVVHGFTNYVVAY